MCAHHLSLLEYIVSLNIDLLLHLPQSPPSPLRHYQQTSTAPTLHILSVDLHTRHTTRLQFGPPHSHRAKINHQRCLRHRTTTTLCTSEEPRLFLPSCRTFLCSRLALKPRARVPLRLHHSPPVSPPPLPPRPKQRAWRSGMRFRPISLTHVEWLPTQQTCGKENVLLSRKQNSTAPTPET